MKAIYLQSVAVSIACILSSMVQADGFVITPYQGSELVDNKEEAFNEYRRIIGPKKETETLEGALIRQRYKNPKGRSTLEIERNYRDALRAQGFSVDFSCTGKKECGDPARAPSWKSINDINLGVAGDVRYLTGQRSTGGARVYVAIAINPQTHYIHSLETKAMETGLVSVEGLAAGLEKDGRVELQGVFFDTGKASLKPESTPALEQVAELMRRQPNLRLDVVGHTDNVGQADANLRLSKARVDAVRNALIQQYGIAPGRLGAKGMGSRQPVADNTTEAGRAKNRRVELVRQ